MEGIGLLIGLVMTGLVLMLCIAVIQAVFRIAKATEETASLLRAMQMRPPTTSIPVPKENRLLADRESPEEKAATERFNKLLGR